MNKIEQAIERAKAEYEGPMFMGVPDAWYEPHPTYWCKNGHRSHRYLKSERLRANVCLACNEPVMIGPPELPGIIPK